MTRRGRRSRTPRHVGVAACVVAVCLVVVVGPAAADPGASCQLSESEIAPGESLTLDASQSEDAEGYRFDESGTGSFGDYTVAETRTVTYEEPGTYEPRVQVRSPEGETDTADCGTVTVTDNQPPSAAFAYTPSAPTPDETTTFVSESTDPDGDIVAYTWRVDGETVGERPTLEYAFPGPGEYTVELTVTDEDGAEGVTEQNVTVAAENEPPSVSLSYEPATPDEGETVAFTVDASDPDGNVTTYEWAVDGEVVTETVEPVFTRAFPGPGEYTVGVTVTDDDGTERSAETVVAVSAASANEVRLAVDPWNTPVSPRVGETVTMVATRRPDPRVTYRWDLDGDTEFESNGVTVGHAFTAEGRQTVRVRAVALNGTTSQGSVTVPVRGESEDDDGSPGQPFWTVPADPRPGDTVTLVVSPDVTTDRDEYRWDLDGDGETDASGQVATYNVSTPDQLAVELAVEGPDGTTTTFERSVDVGDTTRSDQSNQDDTDPAETDQNDTEEDQTEQEETDLAETTTRRTQAEPTADRQQTATDRESTAGSSTATAEGDGPGFGQGVAILALLAVVVRLARRESR